jgi:hypothetical protein
MFKCIAIVLSMLLPIAAFADLSDADAKRIAVSMDKTITKARADLNDMIQNGVRVNYATLRAKVSSELQAWPAQNLGNRAAFPYFECQQAARDLLQYGDSWSRNDQNRQWRDRAASQFRESHTGCKRAIQRPDMSLKNIQ